MTRLEYPATTRNRQPLLAVLRELLPSTGTVLEIASGSGEHAVFFSAALPELTWQPSDPEHAARKSIAAWIEHDKRPNVRPPVELDTLEWPWPVTTADAILCVNMVHIAPWAATEGLMTGAGRLLCAGAPLVLYGPYRVDGHTAPSNEDFDRSLRARDPRWGVRELREVERVAGENGLTLAQWIEMPANNLVVVLRRDGAADPSS